jgi:DegV family protein with EDD domain
MTMSSICIVTDSSVQFTQPSFPGRSHVQVIPLELWMEDKPVEQEKYPKPSDLPLNVNETLRNSLVSPSLDGLKKFLTDINSSYSHILGIFSSSYLTNLVQGVLEAGKSLHTRAAFSILDSQSISLGLGYLVQVSAEALSRGVSLTEVERLVRSIIPKIYGVFCAPAFSYLRYSGFVDFPQAITGELLGLHPIFALEEGKLTPLLKVRNHKQALDFFQEFLDEFDRSRHISLVQSGMFSANESRLLRECAQDIFPHTPFTEHPLNLPMAILFGPNVMGLFVIE